jgi:hypothetical protein
MGFFQRKGFVACLTFALTLLGVIPAKAESKWTPITESDYIFGYTSYKYSCWPGVDNENLPTIEVFSNNSWVTAVTGQILPVGSDIKLPCDSQYPIAVGFVWTVMAPSPPAYQTNRYTALYRQKIPDKTILKRELVTKQVYEARTYCCESKVVSKKVPYNVKVKRNGRYIDIIKYRNVKSTKQVRYTENVLIDKSEWVDVKNTIPGFTGTNGNISIYSSESAMINEAINLARALACALRGGTNC